MKLTLLLEVLSFIDTMVGGDEVQVQEVEEGNVQDETQGQQLTDEEIKEIKEEVDKKGGSWCSRCVIEEDYRHHHDRGILRGKQEDELVQTCVSPRSL